MNCSDNLRSQIDALAAGELSRIRAWAVGRHARQCQVCSAHLAQAQALLTGLRAAAREQGSDMLRARVFAAMGNAPVGTLLAASPGMHTTASNGGRAAGGRDAASSFPTGADSRSLRRKRVRLIAQLAGACGLCALLAAILFPMFSQDRHFARDSGKRMQAMAKGVATFSQDYDETVADTPSARPGPPSPNVQLRWQNNLTAGNTREYQVSHAKSAVTGVVRRNIIDRSNNQQLEDVETPNAPPNPGWNPTPAAIDRYLIRNAILIIEVKDARAAHGRLLTAAQQSKGYLSNLQETVDALGQRTITLQVRVPARSFDGSLKSLSELGKVMEKHVSAEDVTEEYVDTESTVRNQKRTEERLLSHLSRTARLSDTLLVEKELTRVREEIEQHEGRLRFLSHRIQYSTMDVTLREEAKALPAVPPASYSTGKEASAATRSLVEFLRSVWTVVVWMGVWSVVWVPLSLVAGWGIRRVWRAWAG